jgi:hypothetical protein
VKTWAADQHQGGSGTATPTRRLLKRPTIEETVRIVGTCLPETLTVPVLIAAIRDRTNCSRATANRAVDDTFKAGILRSVS